MYINDALILRGILRVLDTLGIYAYDSSASDFYTNIYSELSFKLYIFSFIYCVYIQTHLAVALITNIFIKQSTVLGGEEVKI